MYKTEWILEGSSNCCLNFALHYNSKYWIGILHKVFWPPIHAILVPLPMVFDPTPWYIDIHTLGISTTLHIVFWPPLPMEYRLSYPWYFDPADHGILPPIHGILTPLPKVFWLTPYPWYIDPPTHGILTPHPWYFDPPPMVFWPPNHGISTL